MSAFSSFECVPGSEAGKSCGDSVSGLVGSSCTVFRTDCAVLCCSLQCARTPVSAHLPHTVFSVVVVVFFFFVCFEKRHSNDYGVVSVV